MAKLYFYYGTMFSAKSAKLLIMVHNFRERGLNPLVLTSSLDTRFGKSGEIHSRIPGLACEARPVISSGENTTDIERDFDWSKKYDMVVCDEIHFFSEEQIRQLARIVDRRMLNVFCFGLRSSFKGELFASIKVLMALADTIRENKTICSCGSKAIMNAIVGPDGTLERQGSEIKVGDSEYMALCRSCYRKRIAPGEQF